MNIQLGRASATVVSLAISDHVLRDLWTYSLVTTDEISGIGEVHGPPANLQIKAPLHLLKQKGNFVNTELDVGEIASLVEQYILTGKDPEVLRFWYHSHGMHDTYFSSQDRITIQKLSAGMPVCVAGVVNHKGNSQWQVILNETITCEFSLKIPGNKPTEEEISRASQVVTPILRKLPVSKLTYSTPSWGDLAW